MATKIIIKGNKKFISNEIKKLDRSSDILLESLSRQTETVIKGKIKESLVRPNSTGNLENSFFAERIGTRFWGIGKIPFLNKHAPYWRWINFGVAKTGRTTPPPTTGSFSPGNPAPDSSDFRKGRFAKGSDGYLVTPVKPIEPHNYIARTLIEIPKIILSTLRRIKK